jgi:hypothetical protein
MKIAREHYEHMKEAMRPLAEKIPAYRETLKADAGIKDLEMRLRWDWFHASKLTPWACAVLYKQQGLHDAHIDTALRAIVKELIP